MHGGHIGTSGNWLVVDVILGVAVLALLIYRQLSARQVNAAAVRLMAILVIIGVLQTYQFLSKNHAHPLTIAAIAGSVALAAIFGWLRASTVRGLAGGRRPGLVQGQLADRRLVGCLAGRAPGL